MLKEAEPEILSLSLLRFGLLLGLLPLLIPTALSGVLGSFDSASTMSNEFEPEPDGYLPAFRYDVFRRFSFESTCSILDFLTSEVYISGIKVTSSNRSEKLIVSFILLLVYPLFYVVLFLASDVIFCKFSLAWPGGECLAP